ncbi:hypothetical protein Rhal01_02025 [Rubritalea halochordaticola]|uniref:FecR protein domain-containing protein n=1 Tax=Rubritalea halochordaticola TaxID=714537 RepID=A0ABP9V440_9BACT
MKRRELEHQIQDLLDGNLDVSQLDALQYELRTNSEAREIYRDFIHLQNAMQMNATVPAAVGKALIPIDRVVRRQRVKALRLTALASAAVLLVGLVTLALLTVRVKPSEQAVFRVAPGTQYSVSHTKEALEGGMQLEVGSRLQLQQGTVELLFGNGVKSVVMAPADMILLKGNHLQLNKGRAWFEVSQGAEGFTVLTKELKVVDLGTQFGVLADHVKYDEVHVFKGKVQVETLKEGAEAEIIKAGEARKLEALNALLAVDVEPEKFIE